MLLFGSYFETLLPAETASPLDWTNNSFDVNSIIQTPSMQEILQYELLSIPSLSLIPRNDYLWNFGPRSFHRILLASGPSKRGFNYFNLS